MKNVHVKTMTRIYLQETLTIKYRTKLKDLCRFCMDFLDPVLLIHYLHLSTFLLVRPGTTFSGARSKCDG